MICLNCKFASLDKAESGRLSPTGMGKCMWRKKFRVSGAASAFPYQQLGDAFVIAGGTISRKRGGEYPTACDTFQQIK